MNIIDTDLGQIVCRMGGKDFVDIEAQPTINRVDYRVTARLIYQDDKWQLGNFHELHMRRLTNGQDATSAERRQVIDILERAWAEFIAIRPDVVREAEKGRIEGEIRRLKDFIEQNETANEQLRRNLTQRTQELAKL